MQRWRVLSYVAIASAVLSAPSVAVGPGGREDGSCGDCPCGRGVRRRVGSRAVRPFDPVPLARADRFDLDPADRRCRAGVCRHAGRPGAGRRPGHPEDARCGRRGAGRGLGLPDAAGQGPPAPGLPGHRDPLLHRRDDPRRCPDRSSGGFLPGGPFLLAGRVCGHEPGGAGKSPRRRRGANQLRQRPSARLPHRDHHRHAHRRPGAARRHDDLHRLRREGL